MNRCPITYQVCEKKYSLKGLKLLSKNLLVLNDFPYTAKQQLEIAARFETKLSIQGVQPKISTILNVNSSIFEIVESGGRYIFKPPHDIYNEVPENEDLSMKLAKLVGIETPFHGMVYNIDQTLSYFIKRFDRNKNRKYALEDFSQLLGFSRETKYESSMEQVVSVIDKYCSFPKLEKVKLFKLTIFNFLIGNEDMHLKNFSLLKSNDISTLSPAYDLLNTTIIMNAKDEIALPIAGKKSQLKRKDFVDYFGLERLKLPLPILEAELLKFEKVLPSWRSLILESFLSKNTQDHYMKLIDFRWKKLQV